MKLRNSHLILILSFFLSGLALFTYVFLIDLNEYIDLFFSFFYLYVFAYLFYNIRFVSSLFFLPIIVVYLISIYVNLNLNTFIFDIYLAPSLLERSNVIMAQSVLLFSCSLYTFLSTAILFSKKFSISQRPNLIHEKRSEAKLAKLGGSISLFIGIIILALTAGGGLISSQAYSPLVNDSAIISSGGIKTVGIYFLVISIFLFVTTYGFFTTKYNLVILTVVASIFYFQIFRGERSTSIAVFLGIVVVHYLNGGKSLKDIAKYFWVFIILVLFLQLFGILRSVLSNHSVSNAFQIAFERAILELFQGKARIQLFPHAYWHLLNVIDLYSSGIQLKGISFINIFPQSIPKFIAESINYTRPQNGAEQLARYRANAGGMFTIALAYWNLGILGVGIFISMLVSILCFIETWILKQKKYLYGIYVAFAGMFVEGMIYGWQPLFRLIEITVVLFVIYKLLFNQLEKRV